jgi:cellulose synthase (UDP-forming)
MYALAKNDGRTPPANRKQGTSMSIDELPHSITDPAATTRADSLRAEADAPRRRRNASSDNRMMDIFDRGQVQSPSLILLVVLATVGTLLYASFLLNPANVGDPLPYIIVVVSETFLIFQVLLALWTALSSTHNPRDFAFHAARRRMLAAAGDAPANAQTTLDLDDRPASIDILITTYGEPLEVIETTVRAALAIRGRHGTYVCDDAGSDEVRELAERLGASYLARSGSSGAKAGNINAALATTDADYFAIFDADFVPEPGFLEETMPFFAADDVAFVQTPQVYGNISGFISRASAFMQTVFYSLTQPGKNRFNAAFCVGTNVVFRRSAIDDIGGIYEKSKSEDIWTSVMLHEKGWTSIYIPMRLAIGATPDRIETFTKQQVRWATGAFEILLTHNPFGRGRRLTTDQRLQYLATTTFYFGGIVPLALILLPPLQIYLNLTPVSLDVPFWQWVLYYCGFYVMQIVMAFYTIGSFRWEALLLSAVSFPIYTKAFFNALFRRSGTWHVTGSKGKQASPFLFIRSQMLMFVFLLATTIVGFWKFDWTGEFSIALFWNLLNTIALGALIAVAVHESVTARRAFVDASRRRSTANVAALADTPGVIA